MKIAIILPDDKFLVSKNLSYLINLLKKKHEIVKCILLSPSPYGKRKSFLNKIFSTYKIFGFRFVAFYGYKFILNSIFSESNSDILKRNNIDYIKPKWSINSNESINLLNECKTEIVISILGNEIFKKKILNEFKYGCINLHTSLLPKYRGVMPSFWVLKNNEKYTGVSVFKIDEGIDTGPIILQKKVHIKPDDSQMTLIKKTKKIGMKLISDSIDLIEKGNVKYISNDNKSSSYLMYYFAQQF